MFMEYIALFFIALAVASLFCIGLWVASQGEHEIAPDGKERKVWGMVLYPLKRHLENKKVEKVYYDVFSMKELAQKAKVLFPDETFEFQYMPEQGMFFAEGESYKSWVRCAAELKEKLFVDIQFHDNYFFSAWKEYVSINYFAKPIIGCYKCYASFWGSIVYWSLTAIASYLGFVKYDVCVVLPLWFLFVFCLIPFNMVIYKLTEE